MSCKLCFAPGEGPPGACERCGEPEGTSWQPGRTIYHHEPGKVCPNQAWVLCAPCAEEFHECMNEMWDHARPQL